MILIAAGSGRLSIVVVSSHARLPLRHDVVEAAKGVGVVGSASLSTIPWPLRPPTRDRSVLPFIDKHTK